MDVSPLARLFFIGTWNFADDNGVLENKPKQLLARIFPGDRIKIDKLILELVDKGLLLSYEVDGQPYLMIKNLWKHQVIDRKRKSGLPTPKEYEIKGIQLKSTEISIGREGKGREKERNKTSNTPPSPDGDNGSAIQARIYDPIVFSLTYFQLKKSAFEKLRRKGAALSDQEFKDLLDRVDMYAAENPRKYKRRADGSLANPSGVINTFLERKFIDNRGSPGSPSEPKGYNSLREFYHKQKEPE